MKRNLQKLLLTRVYNGRSTTIFCSESIPRFAAAWHYHNSAVIKPATEDWKTVAQSVDVSSRLLIGRKVTGWSTSTLSTTCPTRAAGPRTDVVDCELEREHSVSQSCDLLGTSLSRCLVFSRHSTSLITPAHQV